MSKTENWLKFRVEWRTNGGASSEIEAHSAEEAAEIEKKKPFSGSCFEIHHESEYIIALPADSTVSDKGGVTIKYDDTVEDGRSDCLRRYVVSNDYWFDSAREIFAPTAQDAEKRGKEYIYGGATGWATINKGGVIKVSQLSVEN